MAKKKKTARTETFDTAYRDFLVAVQGPWEEMQRQLMESQFNYSRAVQEASMHPNAASLNASARRAHLAATSNVAKDVDFAGAVKLAYRGYLKAIQAAWGSADPEALDPTTLAAVGNQALSVCSWVSWGLQESSSSAPPA